MASVNGQFKTAFNQRAQSLPLAPTAVMKVGDVGALDIATGKITPRTAVADVKSGDIIIANSMQVMGKGTYRTSGPVGQEAGKVTDGRNPSYDATVDATSHMVSYYVITDLSDVILTVKA